MGLRETLHKYMLSRITMYGSQKAFCEATGTKAATINDFFKDASKNPGLAQVQAIIESLDDKMFVNFVKELRPNIMWDVCDANYHEVKTYNILKAESLENLTEDRVVFNLKIPSTYFPSDFAIIMRGQSMDSTIPEGSAVGITTSFDFSPGEIYLCSLPYEKLTLKRVILYPDKNLLEFRADSKTQPDEIRPHIYPYQDGIEKIVGQMTWVATRRKK